MLTVTEEPSIMSEDTSLRSPMSSTFSFRKSFSRSFNDATVNKSVDKRVDGDNKSVASQRDDAKSVASVSSNAKSVTSRRSSRGNDSSMSVVSAKDVKVDLLSSKQDQPLVSELGTNASQQVLDSHDDSKSLASRRSVASAKSRSSVKSSSSKRSTASKPPLASPANRSITSSPMSQLDNTSVLSDSVDPKDAADAVINDIEQKIMRSMTVSNTEFDPLALTNSVSFGKGFRMYAASVAMANKSSIDGAMAMTMTADEGETEATRNVPIGTQVATQAVTTVTSNDVQTSPSGFDDYAGAIRDLVFGLYK
jgi:hypothetical protein